MVVPGAVESGLDRGRRVGVEHHEHVPAVRLQGDVAIARRVVAGILDPGLGRLGVHEEAADIRPAEAALGIGGGKAVAARRVVVCSLPVIEEELLVVAGIGRIEGILGVERQGPFDLLQIGEGFLSGRRVVRQRHGHIS